MPSVKSSYDSANLSRSFGLGTRVESAHVSGLFGEEKEKLWPYGV